MSYTYRPATAVESGKYPSLVGREDVRRRLDDVTAGTRAGRGGCLVLRGEAGIGKTALLNHVQDTNPDLQVIRASGSEFETELPYSALHQLCLPLLDRLSELPRRHHEALKVAFGLVSGVPDPFQVGLAVLGLAASAAAVRPLLCLVDDAQWLDSASSQAMLFLARRVATDPVAVVFAVRTPHAPDELDELEGLDLRGLNAEEAALLLATRSLFPLDDQVRDRLVTEAQGNPLALLELPRAGGFAPPGTSSAPTRVERGYGDRIAGLSAAARLLLVAASADPTGDSGLLWQAAGLLGIDLPASSAEAAATGLAEFGTRVRFCHPLARSAVYRAGRAQERHAAHRALAEATDPVTAPDRRAWHRAQGSPVPDDEIAAELERSACRARARGGVAAAAAFLERAMALSLDDERRIERTLAAAEVHVEAGAIGTAARLLATTDGAALDESQRIRTDLLRGRVAFTGPDSLAGPRLTVSAAQRLAAVDPARARDGFVDALEMGLAVGHADDAVAEVLGAARATAPAAAAPDLLEALLTLAAKDYHAAGPMARDVLRRGGEALWVRRPALATTIAIELWDPHLYTTVVESLVEVGRRSGAPALLSFGLAQQSVGAVMTGDIPRAVAIGAEQEAVTDASRTGRLIHHRLYLAAFRGRRAEALELAETARRSGIGHSVVVLWDLAILHNGLGDHAAALATAQQAIAEDDIFLAGPVLPELVEAAARSGRPDVATRALRALTDSTRISGSAFGLGTAAAMRGLVTGGEEHFREAVDRLSEGPMLPYRGRVHLLYGEWLRGAGRRQEARAQLRTAHELLSAAGAQGFAQRAAGALTALGDHVGAAAAHPLDNLTMQEMAVTRAVVAGATSHEVAIQLFISKRTVDAHLRNIFRKLGVTSRRQLSTYKDVLG